MHAYQWRAWSWERNCYLSVLTIRSYTAFAQHFCSQLPSLLRVYNKLLNQSGGRRVHHIGEMFLFFFGTSSRSFRGLYFIYMMIPVTRPLGQPSYKTSSTSEASSIQFNQWPIESIRERGRFFCSSGFGFEQLRGRVQGNSRILFFGIVNKDVCYLRLN